MKCLNPKKNPKKKKKKVKYINNKNKMIDSDERGTESKLIKLHKIAI